MALKMKVDATKKDEVSREDLGYFVEKSLKENGFPNPGWLRYVYFQDGFLQETEDVLQGLLFDIEDVIFVIEPWESYINFGYPEGIHKDSSWDDKISAYINDSIF